MALPVLLKHQNADGSWDAAGPDAARGKIWRTALNAFALIMINPPKPPQPTPDEMAPGSN